MTVSHILAVLSSSDLAIDVEVIEIPDKDKPIECDEVFVNEVLVEIRNIIGEKA